MSYTICLFNELIHVVHVGGWKDAPDGPFFWGYCFLREENPESSYCDWNPNYPCASGREYYGRGPIQLSWLVHDLIIHSLMI